MKKFLFAILTLSLLTACTSGEKPPTYAELQQHQQITGTAAAEPETEVETADPAEEEAARLREEHSKAAAAVLTENRDVRFGTTVFGTQTAVECDGGIYIDCGMIICLLNRKTGMLQGLCSDPLCSHTSCIESHTIYSMVSDGARLYFKGTSETYTEFSSKKWDKSSFIVSYDPENDKLEFLEVWEKDSGSVSTEISLYNGYLYYTKKMNEQTNSLFRIKTKGGKSERLTFKDEFVQQWTVTGEKIIYRTDAFTLKNMNMDGSGVETMEEFICMVYADGDTLYKISSKDESAFLVYQNDEALPVRVFSPVGTVVMDGALWYTLHDERNLGTYIDKNGRKQNIKTYNGTAFYYYDLTSRETTEYDCPFSYGVREFCGMIGNYMLIGGCTEEKAFSWWLFNPEDPNEAYRLYEY